MDCQELTDLISNIKAQLTELDKLVGARNPEGAITIKKQIDEEIDKYKWLCIEYARKLFDQDFLGPEEIKAVFGLESIEVPPIPFSRKELERAKKLGQFLILRTDQIPTDKLYLPHTQQTLGNAPETRWALVTKKLIPNSTSKTYLQQTEQIIKYLKEAVFSGRELPSEYDSAAEDFRDQKENLRKLAESSDITEQLADLDIIKLTCQSRDELLYDLEMYKTVTGQYLLPGKFALTSSCDYYSGLMISVGAFDSDGVYIRVNSPDASDAMTGAVFSRSQ